jgi:hypothetical protein
MSKLTDKIQTLKAALQAVVDDCADKPHWGSFRVQFEEWAAQQADILADVKELEQRARPADDAYVSGLADGQATGMENMQAAIRAAKREAYEHALALTVTADEYKQGRRSDHIRADIAAAINALNTEGNDNEQAD